MRDNRVNQNSDREAKSSTHVSSLDNVQRLNNISEKRYIYFLSSLFHLL